jgi:hypothetical protein
MDAIREELGPEAFARVNKAADEAGAWMSNELLGRLVDAKIIKQETADALKNKYPHYLPSEVDIENVGEQQWTQPRTSAEPLSRVEKGFLKQKKGTLKPIKTDTLRLMHQAMARTVTAAHKTKLMDQIYKEFGTPVAKHVPLAREFEAKRDRLVNQLAEKKDNVLRERFEKIKKALAKIPGLPTIEEKLAELKRVEITDRAIEGGVVEREAARIGQRIERVESAEAPRGFKRQEIARVPAGYSEMTLRGTDGVVYALPQEMADMVNGLNRMQSDMVTAMMAKYNAIFRAGATTYRVGFAVVSNPQRDVQTAFTIMAGKQNLPGKDEIGAYMTSLFESLKDQVGIGSKKMDEFRQAGSAYGGLISSMPQVLSKTPLRRWKLMDSSEQMQNVVGMPVEIIERAGKTFENATRLAEFMRTEKLLPPGARAVQARDITVDFEKYGNAMRVVRQWVPFLNPNVQGNVNLLRAFRDKPGTTAARFAMAVLLPEMMLYMWNSLFDNDDKIDEWIKDNYWYVNTGNTVKDENGNNLPVLITIRKGEYAQNPGFVVPIGKMVRGVMDYVHRKDPAAWRQYARNFITDSAYGFLNTTLPPVIKTAVGVTTNYDLFRRKPIVWEYQMEYEPWRRFSGYESRVARRLGEIFNTSPAMLEYAARGVFPAIKQITPMVDLLVEKAPERAMTREKNAIQKFADWLPLLKVPSGRGAEYDEFRASIEGYKQKRATEIDVAKEAYLAAARAHIKQPTPETEKQMAEIIANLPMDDKDRKGYVARWTKQLANTPLSGLAMERVTPLLDGLNAKELGKMRRKFEWYIEYILPDDARAHVMNDDYGIVAEAETDAEKIKAYELMIREYLKINGAEVTEKTQIENE